MMRTLTTWLAVALAGTALVAGCGGSSTSTSSSQAAKTSTAAGGAASSSGSGGAASSSGSGEASSGAASSSGAAAAGSGTGASGATLTPKQAGALAVSSCKKAIDAEASISAAAKAKLIHICEKASGGSKVELEKVAHEECVALVEATPLPTQQAKQRALAICKAPA